MQQTKPIDCLVFIGAAACLFMGIWPGQAFSQAPGAGAPMCVRSEDKQAPFEAPHFYEIRNAYIRQPREIVFLEESLPAVPVASRQDSYVRSHVFSTEIPADFIDDYTISRVVMEKDVWNEGCKCLDCELVEFQISLECNTCTRNAQGVLSCVPNAKPQWISVNFNPALQWKNGAFNTVIQINHMTYGKTRVEVDVLGLELVGSQLCWRAIFPYDKRRSENASCKPTLKNFSVEYQALKSGEYTRSSPMPIANMAFTASYVTPKSRFDTDASVKALTGLKDYSRRGMVRAYELYNPEHPTETTKKLKWHLKGGVSQPTYMDYGGPVFHVNGPVLGNWVALALDTIEWYYSPGSPCDALLYDLDRNNVCNFADGQVLKNWLMGIDLSTLRAHGATPAPFDLSTPAVFTSNPLMPPPWVRLASQKEIDAYHTWKSSQVRKEMAAIIVGSATGELYGIDAGVYMPGEKDGCLDSVRHYRGYFKPYPGCLRAGGNLKRYDGELEEHPGAGKVKTVHYPHSFARHYLLQYNKKYYGTEGQFFTHPRPSINSSVALVDVDFTTPSAPSSSLRDYEDPNKPLTWQNLRADMLGPQGGHTLVINGTGPEHHWLHASFMSDYLYPRFTYFWELNLKMDSRIYNIWKDAPLHNKPSFDRRSSRHTPLVGRFMLNRANSPLPTAVSKWLAIVGSDYRQELDIHGKPMAGVVLLVDLHQGNLVHLTHKIPGADWAGFILLEAGEGVGGEIVGLDLQHQALGQPREEPDGIYDVLYIPTTLGRVYRVNLLNYHPEKATENYGDAYRKCKVIDIPALLRSSGVAEDEAKRQGIYSNMAVYKDGKIVRIYVGTADNPDIYDQKIDPHAQHYYVFGFELDESSLERTSCAPAKLLWANKLPQGERVWGGLSVSASEVAVGTAVGGSSDMCGLDSATEGHLYVLDSERGDILQSRQGQIVASPVAFDGHYLYVDAQNNFSIVPSEGIRGWNNPPDASSMTTTPRMRVLEQVFEQDVRREKPPYVLY